MPNLIQRIVGDLTPEERLAGEKISLHAFVGALGEYRRGKVSGAEFIAAFNLTTAQQNQGQVLSGLITAAPNEALFLDVFRDLLYRGEGNLNPRYRDIALILARLEDEVTDQGGTLP